MRWKLFTLLAVLALMVYTASPIKVKAQGLVEYALILVLAAVGPGEIVGIHWVPGPSSGNPQVPRIPPGDMVTWTYRVTNTGDSTCTKTFSSSVEVNEGINTLNASISGEEFSINGVTVGFLEPCPAGGNRNLIEVGRPFPLGLAAQGAADPNALAYEFQKVQIKSWDVSGSADGDTRATSPFVDSGYYILLAPLS